MFEFKCEVCNTTHSSKNALKKHTKTKKHKNNIDHPKNTLDLTEPIQEIETTEEQETEPTEEQEIEPTEEQETETIETLSIKSENLELTEPTKEHELKENLQKLKESYNIINKYLAIDEDDVISYETELNFNKYLLKCIKSLLDFSDI